MVEREMARSFAVQVFTEGAFVSLAVDAHWEDWGDKLSWFIELPPPHDPMQGSTSLKQPEEVLNLVRTLRRDIAAKRIPLSSWQEPPIPIDFEIWYVTKGPGSRFAAPVGPLKSLCHRAYLTRDDIAIGTLRQVAAGDNPGLGVPVEAAQFALESLTAAGRIPT